MEFDTAVKEFEVAILQIKCNLSIAVWLRNLENELNNRKQNPSFRLSDVSGTLKAFWPNIINNEELWRTTKCDQMKVLIKRRKWNWIGRTVRRPAGDIARNALDWNPQGTRKKGRPKTMWRGTIVNEALFAQRNLV